jgi:hypothetical protein
MMDRRHRWQPSGGPSAHGFVDADHVCDVTRQPATGSNDVGALGQFVGPREIS